MKKQVKDLIEVQDKYEKEILIVKVYVIAGAIISWILTLIILLLILANN